MFMNDQWFFLYDMVSGIIIIIIIIIVVITYRFMCILN